MFFKDTLIGLAYMRVLYKSTPHPHPSVLVVHHYYVCKYLCISEHSTAQLGIE